MTGKTTIEQEARSIIALSRYMVWRNGCKEIIWMYDDEELVNRIIQLVKVSVDSRLRSERGYD